MSNSISIVSLILVLCLYPFSSNGQVVINEVMAANAATIDDPDFHKKADWIELFNTSNQTIELSGYYLSDDLDNSFQWQISSGTSIAPKGYLIFWADGENTGNHCNFKLAKAGESVGLFDPSGSLVDSITYPVQTVDISFGRMNDGATNFTFFALPTPNASNSTLGFDGIVPFIPKFSTEGGVINQAFELSLSSIGGTIHYTLDGSIPSETSPVYNQPIFINETKVLRARVFSPGQIAGKTISHTYFLNEKFDKRGLPVISISTNPAFFWDPIVGIYAQDFKPEWEYPINIEFFENEEHNIAAFNESAGIKINGNNSWQFPQKILGIYFRNDYGKKYLDYPLFPDRDRDGFDYFALRVSGNDQGSTFFKDALFQEIVKNNMDFELQGYRPASVYVNGEYLGLHNIRSKQNEEYFEYHFDLKRGEYDLITNRGEVDAGDDSAYKELINLINKDLSIAVNFQALEKVLDIDNTIDHFVSKIWLSDLSWGHNIKMWKPKSQNSKWRWVLKDVDRGFDGIDNHGIDYFITPNISPSSYEYARLIVRQLFQSPTFSERFIRRFADHLHTTFHPSQVNLLIDKFQATIGPEMPYHLGVWGGVTADYGDALPSETHWKNEIEELKTYVLERRAFLYQDIAQHFSVDPISTLGTICIPAKAGHIEMNQLKIPAANWSGTYFQKMPITLEAKSQIGFTFKGWTAANYETIIPQSTDWKYFDRAPLLDTNWQTLDFDDTNWSSGFAQFGYGDDDEKTTISYGDQSDNKLITAYFRKSFEIEDATQYADQLVFNILKDDGAIIYLNGTEINRLNMPAGNIEPNTTAYHTIEKEQEHDFHQILVNSKLLRTGKNVIAVAVFQRSASSSDLSFDLSLKGIKLNPSSIVSEAETMTVELSSDTVFIAQYSSNNACILPSLIDQPTTLTLACSPYQTVSDLMVAPNTVLSIEAGVELLMPESGSIIIEGGLEIAGTVENPVKIMPNHLIGNTTWGNLQFRHSTNNSHLKHLQINGATKGYHPIRDNAAISVFYAQLELNNVKMENLETSPIYAQYADIKLDSCQFHTLAQGAMLQLLDGTGSILNSNFRGSTAKNMAAIRIEKTDNFWIHQNKIYDFFGKNNHGIEIAASRYILIDQNFIHNCTDKGIIIEDDAFVIIKQNTITNCKEGIGVKELSVALIDENTLYNNEIAIRSFEKEPGSGGGSVQISNSILSNSAKSPIEVDEVSFLQIDHCLSDTEILEGSQNLHENPFFVNPSFYNFQLQNNSPAKKSGLQNGQAIDLGTKSFNFSITAPVLITEINYHPANEAEAEYITLFNPGQSTLDLSGYELNNAVTLVIPKETLLAPNQKLLLVKNKEFFAESPYQILEWTSGKLKNSGETIELKDPNGILVDHVQYSNEEPWPTAAAGTGAYLSLKNPTLDNHIAANWETVNLSVSTDDSEYAQSNLILYPNPASHYLFIDLKPFAGMKGTIQLTNQLGQKVEQLAWENIPNEVLKLSIDNKVPGLYYISIDLFDEQRITKKIFIE